VEQLFSQPGESAEAHRKRVANIVCAHRDAIKDGFRCRISAREQSFYDSSDFFSTVQRRADQLASLGDDDISRDIMRMLHEIMLEALSDHARDSSRDIHLRQSLQDNAHGAQASSSGWATEADERADLKALCLNAEELHLARLRASGMLHRQVAAAFGVSAAVVRTRWQRLVGKAADAWSQPGG
jgi:hypothetical protein